MNPGFLWASFMTVLECVAGQERGTDMLAPSSMTVIEKGYSLQYNITQTNLLDLQQRPMTSQR
jgi:hypothetical protein